MNVNNSKEGDKEKKGNFWGSAWGNLKGGVSNLVDKGKQVVVSVAVGQAVPQLNKVVKPMVEVYAKNILTRESQKGKLPTDKDITDKVEDLYKKGNTLELVKGLQIPKDFIKDKLGQDICISLEANQKLIQSIFKDLLESKHTSTIIFDLIKNIVGYIISNRGTAGISHHLLLCFSIAINSNKNNNKDTNYTSDLLLKLKNAFVKQLADEEFKNKVDLVLLGTPEKKDNSIALLPKIETALNEKTNLRFILKKFMITQSSSLSFIIN